MYQQIITIQKSTFSAQHEFITGRSTGINLTEVAQYVSKALDSRRQIDMIYTDFAKAFDSIDHVILLNKLDNFGFSPGIHRIWIFATALCASRVFSLGTLH